MPSDIEQARLRFIDLGDKPEKYAQASVNSFKQYMYLIVNSVSIGEFINPNTIIDLKISEEDYAEAHPFMLAELSYESNFSSITAYSQDLYRRSAPTHKVLEGIVLARLDWLQHNEETRRDQYEYGALSDVYEQFRIISSGSSR